MPTGRHLQHYISVSLAAMASCQAAKLPAPGTSRCRPFNDLMLGSQVHKPAASTGTPKVGSTRCLAATHMIMLPVVH